MHVAKPVASDEITSEPSCTCLGSKPSSLERLPSRDDLPPGMDQSIMMLPWSTALYLYDVVFRLRGVQRPPALQGKYSTTPLQPTRSFYF